MHWTMVLMVASFSFVNSPDMKPIELGFASVELFLRLHEVEAVLDPVARLDRAFQRIPFLVIPAKVSFRVVSLIVSEFTDSSISCISVQ
jgi:hypothetical protein